ncbi:predicted protein [Histoplasma capsulatum H143]|uniref:Uncharacterized protein n=1 Tax=Ajellomyces capsulatus (strain H143) TaxID=544712 RepID=C6H7L5_AJECH|nr:predicted protein [Histoplasma capsulatum H143]
MCFEGQAKAPYTLMASRVDAICYIQDGLVTRNSSTAPAATHPPLTLSTKPKLRNNPSPNWPRNNHPFLRTRIPSSVTRECPNRPPIQKPGATIDVDVDVAFPNSPATPAPTSRWTAPRTASPPPTSPP